MLKRLKELCEFGATTGLYLPGAHDNRSGKSSVSLLFAHVANFVALCGIVVLLIKDITTGVYCAIGYSTLMLTFYLLRSLDKVKLSKEGIELEGDEDQAEQIENKESK